MKGKRKGKGGKSEGGKETDSEGGCGRRMGKGRRELRARKSNKERCNKERT